MTVTIKDVAKLAGVSISTVSRVINNSKPVSKEVKMKVLDVIKELNYKPNEVARTLVTKKSYLIGVIVTDIGNSYVTEMVRGIEEIGKMYNYDILLCSTYGDKGMEERYIQLLKRKQVEGIILISDNLNDEIDKLLSEYKIPFVYLNRLYNKKKYSTVSINNYNAAYQMTKYLIELNHRTIAYVIQQSDKDNIDKSWEEVKLRGYKKAMEEDGCIINVSYTQGREVRDGYMIAKEILQNHETTAIFCSSDKLAIGVMNYLYDNGVSVPEEISVVGYGDINMASIFRPSLTTIREPFYDIGAVSIRRIIKELNGDEISNKEIILPFKIQKRDSCAVKK